MFMQPGWTIRRHGAVPTGGKREVRHFINAARRRLFEAERARIWAANEAGEMELKAATDAIFGAFHDATHPVVILHGTCGKLAKKREQEIERARLLERARR